MIVRYVNHNGTEVNLNKEPYKMLISDLLDYEWEVSIASNRIVGFGYTVKEKALNIDVHRYIDDQYMVCYIKSSEKDNWGADQIIQCEYGIITDHPLWIKETSYTFKSADITSTSNKRYGYRYGYRYASGMKDTYILNEHFAPAQFRLRIYGPCVNPLIAIGGRIYTVHTILEDGEYLEVDSMAQTVIKTMMNGTKVNLFHYRGLDIFQKIFPGKQVVSWDGKFDFDITLFKERSEPEW